MPARLTLFLPDRAARVVTLSADAEHVVGRDAGVQVQAEDDRVSRRHALLRADAAGWTIADLRSKNGTQVDGAAIGATPVPLAATSWVSFGGLLARFEQLGEEAAARQQEEQLRRWQSSVEIQRRLTPALGLGPLLERLLDSVLELTRTERAFVLLADAAGAMTLAACRGLDAEAMREPQFAGSAGAVDLVLREGRTVASSDARQDPRLAGRRSIVERSIQALVCVPLVAADRLVGALYADSTQGGAELTELDVLILEGLAGHAALAITVARLDTELAGVVARLGVPLGVPPPVATRRPQTTAAARGEPLRWDDLSLAHRADEGRA